MGKKLLNDLQRLVDEGVISSENAQAIRKYYAERQKTGPNLTIVIFSVLGALLIGLGIILILAHNWDHFTKIQKTIVAFIPLITGQVFCGFTLWKKNDSLAWRESSATFLVLAIGACIGLVSQIYHIEGSMGGYMLTWTLLSIPIVYVMRSSMASLLYIIGITYFGCETGYFHPDTESPYLYWLLLMLAFPYYVFLIRKQPDGNATFFHHFFIPLSIIICLGSLSDEADLLMMPAYLGLLGVIYLISQGSVFKDTKWFQNPYLILGSLGILITLFILSFEGYWENLIEDKAELFSPFFSTEMSISLGLTMIYLFFLFREKMSFKPLRYASLGALIATVLGFLSPVPAMIVINLIILAIGVYSIREGSAKQRIDIMNFGLITIAILIACRFFDIELSFVTRGILFVLLGIGFFVANYFLTKAAQKRVSHES